MTVIRFKKWSIPVPVYWTNGELVKHGEIGTGKEYVYTLDQSGSFFIVMEAK